MLITQVPAAGTEQTSGSAVGHAVLEEGGRDDAGDDNSILPWKSLSHRVNILCYMCLLEWAAHSWLLDYGCTCSPCIPQMKVVRTAQLGNYA